MNKLKSKGSKAWNRIRQRAQGFSRDGQSPSSAEKGVIPSPSSTSGQAMATANEIDLAIAIALRYQKQSSDILEALHRSPENMESTYERVLSSISSQPHNQELVKRMFMWITHAARSIRLDELVEAVEMRADTKSAEELQDRLCEYDPLVAMCEGLVVVVDPPEDPDYIYRCEVRLVHDSLRQYLLEPPDCCTTEHRSVLEDYQVDSQFAYAEMARACITFLMRCGQLEKHDYGTIDFGSLFDYANRFWSHHIRLLNEIDKDLLDLLFSFFEYGVGFRTTKRWESANNQQWNRTFVCKHEDETRFSATTAALIFDLPNVLAAIKEPGDREDGSFALHYAAKNNSCVAIGHLLGLGFHVHTPYSDRSTPLHHASGKESVGLLLDRGASIEKEDTKGRQPLSTVAFSGHKDAVKVMLDRGADVSAEDKENQTALWAASWSGFADVIQLLLDKGADPNAENWKKRRPLHVAATRGHTNAVLVLLKGGAYINALNGNGDRALTLALMGKKKKDVVRVLLDWAPYDDALSSLYDRELRLVRSQIPEMVQPFLEWARV